MNESAVIIVDMQNEFCFDDEIILKKEFNPLISKINKAVTKLRNKGFKVVWLNWAIDSDLKGMSISQLEMFNSFEYPESMSSKKEINNSLKVLEKGSWSASIVSGVGNIDKDLYIDKKRMSGFWYTDLDKTLKENNIKKLYFTGINTDQCVLATLQDAHFIGYETYLVKDCTSTSSPRYCFDAAMFNVEKCFGKVVDLVEI